MTCDVKCEESKADDKGFLVGENKRRGLAFFGEINDAFAKADSELEVL